MGYKGKIDDNKQSKRNTKATELSLEMKRSYIAAMVSYVIRRLELSLLGEKDLESGYAETLKYSCGRSKSI